MWQPCLAVRIAVQAASYCYSSTRPVEPACLRVCHCCAGTAVVVCSVGSLTYKGNRRSYVEDGAAGSTALELYTALTQLQTAQAEDPFGWVYKVC
jgi:hypothetical protein